MINNRWMQYLEEKCIMTDGMVSEEEDHVLQI